jgi:1,4-dihydroxy-6-naphthoate synthase
MKLQLGFSPCPNDTFIFDALVNGKTDTEGLSFEVIMEDVEKLNAMALKGRLHVTKLSFHAFAHATDHYRLLHAGSALGKGCGPLLIAKKGLKEGEPLENMKIAIPGKNTTANFLLGLYAPETLDTVEMLFSDIEEAVLNDSVDAGVIIHENRFTYQSKGLIKIADLGEFWETTTGYPIPLGGIAALKSLDKETVGKLNRSMDRSIRYAWQNPSSSMDYVKQHASEMQEEVMKEHIALYVNEYSGDLGDAGRDAIRHMIERIHGGSGHDKTTEDIFSDINFKNTDIS